MHLDLDNDERQERLQSIKQEEQQFIFLPAAGYFGSSLSIAGSSGFYWSSSLYASNTSHAYGLNVYSSGVSPSNCDYRYIGRSVRPVLRK